MKDCLFLTLLIIFGIQFSQNLLSYLPMNGNFQIQLHQCFLKCKKKIYRVILCNTFYDTDQVRKVIVF